jgi:hypothetical protein
MSKQLTPEDVEKMSPQQLVEFMTETIPPEKLRLCLDKIEEFPSELPSQIVEPSIVAPPVVPSQINQIDIIRNKCSKYPIIVWKIDTPKGKTGDYVYFYKKGEKGYQLFAKTVEAFDKENCNLEDEEITSVDCNLLEEWITSKVKDGVLDATIKAVIQDYVSNNRSEFFSKCENIRRLLSKYDIIIEELPELEEELPMLEDAFSSLSNEAKLRYLKETCINTSGIIIGDLLPTDNTKVYIYMSQPLTKEKKEYRWKEFIVKLDKLEETYCKQFVKAEKGSEKEKLYSIGFSKTDPKIIAKINKVISKLKSEGIQIPYNFLEAGGSAFGTKCDLNKFGSLNVETCTSSNGNNYYNLKN